MARVQVANSHRTQLVGAILLATKQRNHGLGTALQGGTLGATTRHIDQMDVLQRGIQHRQSEQLLMIVVSNVRLDSNRT